ncbi:antitoxin component YwqK of YwqJK toxin-antitoxin module [Mucilaginibacter sp. UYP25]|uniref:toxin-antitoxin system YwqK family antitoxin n=1 Tax=unclassified Mucilaginibacter TaxID=2617802 RepID=UPI0033908024
MIIKVEFDDLELIGFDGGGSEIFHYQGQPFNGMLVTKDDNNIVRSEEEFINAYKDGIQRYFYPSGNLQEEFGLKNNGLNGVFKRWDDSGNLIEETTWENGVEIS